MIVNSGLGGKINAVCFIYLVCMISIYLVCMMLQNKINCTKSTEELPEKVLLLILVYVRHTLCKTMNYSLFKMTSLFTRGRQGIVLVAF